MASFHPSYVAQAVHHRSPESKSINARQIDQQALTTKSFLTDLGNVASVGLDVSNRTNLL